MIGSPTRFFFLFKISLIFHSPGLWPLSFLECTNRLRPVDVLHLAARPAPCGSYPAPIRWASIAIHAPNACGLLELAEDGLIRSRLDGPMKYFLEQGVRKSPRLPSLEQRLLFAGSLLFTHLSNETCATNRTDPSLILTLISVSSLVVIVQV